METYYAGIGSRETTASQLSTMITLGEMFALWGYVLRSGGAGGADMSFELGCDMQSGKKQIFVPWRDFNVKERTKHFSEQGIVWNNKDILIPEQFMDEMERLSAHYHPNWSACSQWAKKLHTRNIAQVLGPDLRTHSSFVVCYTPDGKASGGTGQAIRVANDYNIQVYNLYNQTDLNDLFEAFKAGK